MDQCLSSAITALLLFAAAKVATPEHFGMFALVFSALNVLTVTTRGLLSARLVLFAAGTTKLHSESLHVLIVSGALGIAGGLVLTALHYALGLGVWVCGLALGLPFALMQDTMRFAAMVSQRPQQAFASDLTWALVSAGTFFGAGTGLFTSLPQVTIAWAVSAFLGWLILLPRSIQGKPKFSWKGWFRDHRRQRLEFALEAFIGAVSATLVLSFAAFFVGIQASAALRGSASVFAPVIVFLQAVPLIVVPEIRTRYLNETWEMLAFVSRLAAPIAVGSLCMGFLFRMLPNMFGSALLGDSWVVARPLVAITAIEYALLAWLSVVNGVLRARGDSRSVLVNRVVLVLSTLVLTASAAILSRSAQGIALALAVAVGVTLLFAVGRLGRAPLRAPAPSGARVEAPGPVRKERNG